MATKERKRRSKGELVKRVLLVFAIWAAFGLGIRLVMGVLAAEPATTSFNQTWQRTDDPVALGLVDRTWMWGPDGFTAAMIEPYTESPGGERVVQYFDKSRMEDNAFRATTPWDVTNGLLVVELITGNMQVGDNDFEQRLPAAINVAGDADDQTGVKYATLADLMDDQPLADGATITQRLDQSGTVTDDPALASFGVTAAYRVTEPGIDHQVASPFWAFMNSTGTVYLDGGYVDAPMFLSAFYATGYPITEAYWTNVKVAGTYQDVLLQCFERRCLTYTPGNVPGWQVEAGNVGQHYYSWRYGQAPVDPNMTPGPSPTATVSGSATPPATGTAPVDATPSVTPAVTAEPTVTSPAEPTATAAEEPYSHFRSWGDPVNPEGNLNGPLALVTSPDGLYIYITEYGAHRVHKYTTDGIHITSWGSEGGGSGQFRTPRGIAVDRQGRVYVTDYQNDRVQIFDANGKYIDQFGKEGAGTGHLDGPRGIAIDSAGNVYVADSVNARVQKFDQSWMYVDHWGDVAGDGELQSPRDIAIDANDVVYVTDSSLNLVKKYSADGVFIDKWGDSGSVTLSGPSGMAMGELGVLYVADANNDQIQMFDLNGKFRGKWSSSNSPSGDLYYPIGVATDADGNVYVTDENGYLHKFGSKGTFLDAWNDGRRGRLGGSTLGLALDDEGYIFLSDLDYKRVQVFDFSGDFMYEFDSLGSVVDMVASPDGFLYAVDSQQGRVLKFERNGDFVDEFGSGSLSQAVSIALDRDGNIYVGDAGTDTVQVFNGSGSRIDSWGGSGDGDGKFNYPAGIAVYGERVYVVDHNNHRVQVFDRDGAYLGQWGEFGDDEGKFAEPQGIGVDADGDVLVVDTGNHRVQKFTPTGEFLIEFGSQGSSDGRFSYPTGIAITFDSSVYILDTGNQRVQLFAQPSQAR